MQCRNVIKHSNDRIRDKYLVARTQYGRNVTKSYEELDPVEIHVNNKITELAHKLQKDEAICEHTKRCKN